MIDEGVNALGWVIFFCVFNMPLGGWTSNRSAKTFASFTTIFCIYTVKKFWLYTSAKHNQIPMCRIAGKIIGGRARKDCIRPENDQISDQIKMILELIKEKPQISRSEISHKMGLHESSVKRRLKMMVDKGVIQRIGSDKGVIGKLNNSILIMKCKIETSNGIMFLKGIDGDKRLEIADFILMEHVAKLQKTRDYDNF